MRGDYVRGGDTDAQPYFEANYFRMGKYQQRLIEHIEEYPNFIQPDHRRNETLGFLKNKTLQDLCISRPKSRLAWGIELPLTVILSPMFGLTLINYISAIGYKIDEEMLGYGGLALRISLVRIF